MPQRPRKAGADARFVDGKPSATVASAVFMKMCRIGLTSSPESCLSSIMTQRNIPSQARTNPSNDAVAARLPAINLPLDNVALAATLVLVLVLIICSHPGAGVGFV